MSLTFDLLEKATKERNNDWGNPSLEFRGLELGGEAGELLEAVMLLIAAGQAQNALKKYARLKNGMAGGKDTREAIEQELADVVISAQLLANDLDINLGKAIIRKFNATSEKNKLPQRIVEDPGNLYEGHLELVRYDDTTREFVFSDGTRLPDVAAGMPPVVIDKYLPKEDKYLLSNGQRVHRIGYVGQKHVFDPNHPKPDLEHR